LFHALLLPSFRDLELNLAIHAAPALPAAAQAPAIFNRRFLLSNAPKVQPIETALVSLSDSAATKAGSVFQDL
jgi:hypothetical protein